MTLLDQIISLCFLCKNSSRKIFILFCLVLYLSPLSSINVLHLLYSLPRPLKKTIFFQCLLRKLLIAERVVGGRSAFPGACLCAVHSPPPRPRSYESFLKHYTRRQVKGCEGEGVCKLGKTIYGAQGPISTTNIPLTAVVAGCKGGELGADCFVKSEPVSQSFTAPVRERATHHH